MKRRKRSAASKRKQAQRAPRPQRGAKQARQQIVVRPSMGQVLLQGMTVETPLAWFVEPIRLQIRRAIRPPTATTRRRQKVIEAKIPFEAFHHMLMKFETGELTGLNWVAGRLQPTRDAPGFLEYEYHLRQPAQLNKFFELQQWDQVIDGTQWKRGWGAQQLHLSQAAGRRGARSLLVSSVSGNVALRLRAPKENRQMPTLRLVFSVMTMDEHNHVLWMQDYEQATKAALRNLTRAGRVGMVSDPLFPTTIAHVNQIERTPAADTIWQPGVQGALAVVPPTAHI